MRSADGQNDSWKIDATGIPNVNAFDGPHRDYRLRVKGLAVDVFFFLAWQSFANSLLCLSLDRVEFMQAIRAIDTDGILCWRKNCPGVSGTRSDRPPFFDMVC